MPQHSFGIGADGRAPSYLAAHLLAHEQGQNAGAARAVAAQRIFGVLRQDCALRHVGHVEPPSDVSQAERQAKGSSFGCAEHSLYEISA
jgi:hypothetical protein